jgi:hypothetical protein
MQLHGSAHVINVSVGDNDLLDLKIVPADYFQYIVDIVTWIDHHRFMAELIPNDRAIALQWTDGKDFVDHGKLFSELTISISAAGE